MKRILCAIGAAVTLALVTGAGNALAGESLLGGSQASNQSESVSNSTGQNANQIDPTLNVPINVAALNSGGTSQSNGGVNQTNGNANATGQDVSQNEGSTQSTSGSGGERFAVLEPVQRRPAHGNGPSTTASRTVARRTTARQASSRSRRSNSTSQQAEQVDPTANVPVNVAIANGGSSVAVCSCDDGDSTGGVDQRTAASTRQTATPT